MQRAGQPPGHPDRARHGRVPAHALGPDAHGHAGRPPGAGGNPHRGGAGDPKAVRRPRGRRLRALGANRDAFARARGQQAQDTVLVRFLAEPRKPAEAAAYFPECSDFAILRP
jgi:hypothetical protein